MLIYFLLVCLPLAVLSEQTKCPDDISDASPPASKNTLWECNNFPSDDTLSGCEWNYSHIHWGEDHIASVPDPAGGSDNVLRIFYPEGSYAGNPDIDENEDMKGGTNFYSQGFEPVNEAYIEYDILFDETFDWARGGKLPGFYGGEGQCSGGVYEECFSMRFSWRADGDVEIYAYMPSMMSECDSEESCYFCQCDKSHCNFDYGHSLGRGSFRFVQTVWYRLGMYIKLNDPDQADAEMQILVDGEVVYRIVGLKIRDTSDLLIDSLLFSTFFGGSSDDSACSVDTYTYFKNFHIFN